MHNFTLGTLKFCGFIMLYCFSVLPAYAQDTLHLEEISPFEPFVTKVPEDIKAFESGKTFTYISSEKEHFKVYDTAVLLAAFKKIRRHKSVEVKVSYHFDHESVYGKNYQYALLLTEKDSLFWQRHDRSNDSFSKYTITRSGSIIPSFIKPVSYWEDTESYCEFSVPILQEYYNIMDRSTCENHPVSDFRVWLDGKLFIVLDSASAEGGGCGGGSGYYKYRFVKQNAASTYLLLPEFNFRRSLNNYYDYKGINIQMGLPKIPLQQALDSVIISRDDFRMSLSTAEIYAYLKNKGFTQYNNASLEMGLNMQPWYVILKTNNNRITFIRIAEHINNGLITSEPIERKLD